MHDIPFTEFGHWRMEFVGDFDSIESLLIIENNKIRDNISLKTQEEKDISSKR
jgi:thiamine pyrophosphokinase